MSVPTIFLSYSHRDERLMEQLYTQLKVLAVTGRIDLWSDERIPPGGDWLDEIDRAMAKAKIAVLLVTADFLASDFIQHREVPALLQRHQKGGLTIFPIIARPCAWAEVKWLADIQVRPKKGRAVWGDGGSHADEDLAGITLEIAGLLKTGQAADRLSPLEPAPAGGGPPAAQLQPVADAFEAINAALAKIGDPGLTADFSQVARIINLAISYGAPLYNNGSPRGCAEVYTHAARALVRRIEAENSNSRLLDMELDLEKMMPVPLMSVGGPHSPAAGRRHAGFDLAHTELWRAVKAGEQLLERDPHKLAWEIRFVFDHILYTQSGLGAVAASLVSDATLEERIPATIKLATSTSELIYIKGLNRGQRWIKGCAAVYLFTARGLLSRLPPLSTRRDDQGGPQSVKAAQFHLCRTVAAGPEAEEDAYKITWDIRHAFDRILSVTD